MLKGVIQDDTIRALDCCASRTGEPIRIGDHRNVGVQSRMHEWLIVAVPTHDDCG